MRIILSRKGFDSSSGGCPSPILPDGAMLSLPIPDPASPVRYEDLGWHGRNVGELAERLSRGRVKAGDRAHLDPDLRREARPRPPGWRPVLGQMGAAQGHLARQGVCAGDLFLFFGLFREVDAELRWIGRPRHVIWGWLQVGGVARVDDVRAGVDGPAWRWAASHPHLAYPPDPGNTLYVAADALAWAGAEASVRGAGTFPAFDPARQLTAVDARLASTWRLPTCFLPRRGRGLSYHLDPARWRRTGGGVLVRAAGRGQEFVLGASGRAGAAEWAAAVLRGA